MSSAKPLHDPPKPHRHSFWAGIGLKDRSFPKKNSSVTLAAYPHQQIHKSSSTLASPLQNGSSRVIAMVGNVRTGIGRMILEELVSQKFIVVALIEKPDSLFSKSVQALASSPSLFHAFVVDSGLFDHQENIPSDQPLIKFNPIDHHPSDDSRDNVKLTKRASRSSVFRSFRLGHNKKSFPKSIPPLSSTTTGSSTLGDSTTELSSYSSVNSNNQHQNHHASLQDSARRRQILELKNIFQAYRVDTVICSFEPQTLEPPVGPRSKARLEDEKQFSLPPIAERARIERMERVVLESCVASGSVHRFGVTIHPTSLGPSVLSPNPTNTIRPHLLSVLTDEFRITHTSPPIHVTEFRWGFLMNDLAFDDSLADGVTAENGLGKWLCEPPRSRWVVDLARRKCLIPVRTSSPKDSPKKGKEKLEPVCMTLAEDVARFIGLACKLKKPWQWKTGRIVGDCVPGGWEETIETIEKVLRKNLDREYVCLSSLTNGYTSDSGSSDSSLYLPKTLSNSDPLDLNSNTSSPRFSVEDCFKFEDELRSSITKEHQDASSVRMKEFVRVWYTPLPQPPPITIDGNRLRQKSRPSSTSILAPRGSFKPQVGENGTLREPTLKAATLGGRKNINGTSNQSLHVAPSLPPPDVNRYPGQAISTDATSPIPSQTPILAKTAESPRVFNEPLSTHKPEEFNFVPKVIVPFNTHPPAVMYTNQSQSATSPQQSSNVLVPNVMIYGAPATAVGAQPMFQGNLSPPGPKLRHHPVVYPHQPPSNLEPPHHNKSRFMHKTHSLSSTGRDVHRIIRRSPLATRVA